MEKTEVKKRILQWVFDNFCETAKCNGINSDSLRYYYPESDLQEIITELLEEDRVSLIAAEHDVNPSIIRVGFVPKEQQIAYLKKNGISGYFCIFPSQTYLMQHYTELDLMPKYPFKKMLKLGTPHNSILYFEWGVLFKYYSDPRYVFGFSDYNGHITSSEKLNEERRITIKTFGVGKNKNGEYVVAVPLIELVNMPSVSQLEWYNMLEPEQEKCAVLKDYLDNLEGCWKFENTIYRSILKEISNINKLTNEIWDCSFFRKEYLENKPVDFDMLYIPTKKVYYDFISLLEKIVVHNINMEFYDKVDIKTIDEKDNKKGSLLCLKEWLQQVSSVSVKDIHFPLKELTVKRQLPAHEIYDDEYDINYFDKQEAFSIAVFKALNTLRRLIQSHPKANGVDIPCKNTERYLMI